MGTAILMMKTQIGLGVLSIPLVFDTLGMIPGIIVLLAIAIITTWVRNDRNIAHVFQPSLTLLWEVRLHRWRVQAQSPRGIRYRRCRKDDLWQAWTDHIVSEPLGLRGIDAS